MYALNPHIAVVLGVKIFISTSISLGERCGPFSRDIERNGLRSVRIKGPLRFFVEASAIIVSSSSNLWSPGREGGLGGGW